MAVVSKEESAMDGEGKALSPENLKHLVDETVVDDGAAYLLEELEQSLHFAHTDWPPQHQSQGT